MWMMSRNIHSLQGKDDSISTALKPVYMLQKEGKVMCTQEIQQFIQHILIQLQILSQITSLIEKK